MKIKTIYWYRYVFKISINTKLWSYFLVLVNLMMLLLSDYSTAATCTSKSIDNKIYSQKEEFVGASNTYNYGVKVGPVSNNLYILYKITISGNDYNAARRVDENSNQTWLKAFSNTPIQKSLSIDSLEQNLHSIT